VNSVYLDNSSLELYHSLLDKKPGATTMRIRCTGPNLTRLCRQCAYVLCKLNS
jgi:SPX domain protein involved in polyphosphate accumulation